MRWVAVCSTLTGQPRLCMTLAACGYEPFVPAQTYWKRPRSGKKLKARVPLFPGYTFARVEPSRIGELMTIDGVRNVLRSVTGTPLCIKDGVVEAFRTSTASGLFDSTKPARYIDGEPVRILDGPLAGLIGKIKSASAKHRPKVLLKFLGQITEVEVPIDKLEQIRAETDKLSAGLWATARSDASARPTPVGALVVSGMNDVLNSADNTTAAWLNRIPVPAWWLLVAIGIGSNFTIGLGAKRFNGSLLLILPLTIAVSLFLIADIDSPRGGVVEVAPQNLNRLAASLIGP